VGGTGETGGAGGAGGGADLCPLFNANSFEHTFHDNSLPEPCATITLNLGKMEGISSGRSKLTIIRFNSYMGEVGLTYVRTVDPADAHHYSGAKQTGNY
jgi:hypothetical protein